MTVCECKCVYICVLVCVHVSVWWGGGGGGKAECMRLSASSDFLQVPLARFFEGK